MLFLDKTIIPLITIELYGIQKIVVSKVFTRLYNDFVLRTRLLSGGSYRLAQ